MKDTKMRLIEVNTTAYEEENFTLVTDLTDAKIKKVIKPIVEADRNRDEGEDSNYDNETLFWALKKAYPKNTIIYYQNGGDTIKI